MRPTVRSHGTLPIFCGVVRVSTRYCSTAARFILRSCAKGSVSRSGNGRGACRRSRWKTRTSTSLLRGGALLGKFAYHKTERIEAGAARAVFLEVLREWSPEAAERARPSLVCVLPRGASSEQRFEITGLPLKLHTNRLARFQAITPRATTKAKQATSSIGARRSST